MLRFILFADDTNTSVTGDNVDSIDRLVYKELDKIGNWFKANRLSLNLIWTNFIAISNKHANAEFNITIDGTSIDTNFAQKFLGV